MMNSFSYKIQTCFSLIVVIVLFWIVSPTNSRQLDNNYETRDTLSPIAKFPLSANNQILIQSGKQEYEVLLERKRNTIYGKCWADAILKLEQSCTQLDEYRQSWLSVLFTHCFLKTSGLGIEFLGDKCVAVVELDVHERFNEIIPQLKECTRNIDLKIFHSYSLFFVHTQSICFYLQSEQWQKHTESLVDNLVQSAQTVSTDLNSAVDNIRQLEMLQNSSLKAQLSLNEELAQAKLSLSKFQEETKEQRDLIEKIIIQFSLLKEFLVVEFTTSSAYIYYIFVMIVIYFVTTPQRTIGVRIILYLLVVVNFVLEKKCLDYLIKFDFLIKSHLHSSDNNLYDQFNLTTNLWIIRKVMLIIMTATYIWWAVTYLDISQVNYKILNDNTILLKSIQKQLIESSPPRYLKYNEYSDQSDDSSEDSYSNDSDSVISTDSEISPDENFPNYNQKYNLRIRSQLQSSSQTPTLPGKYRNESVKEFVRNIRSSQKDDKLNFYSSDEN